MLGLIVQIILILVVIGLLIYAVDLLAGVGIPPPVLIALKIIIILLLVLWILHLAGLIPLGDWPPSRRVP